MREKLVTLPYFEKASESDRQRALDAGTIAPPLAGGGSEEPASLAPVPPMLEPAIVPEVAFFPADHPVASSLVPDSARWKEASRVNLVTLPEPAIEVGATLQWPPAYGALKPGETCVYGGSAPKTAAPIDPESVAIYAEAVEESRERAREAERARGVPDARMPKWLREPEATPNCTGPGQGIEGAACKSLGLFRDSIDRPVCASCLKGAGLATERASRRAAGDALRSWASTYVRHRECPELMGAFEASEELGGYAPGGRRAAE